MNLADPTGCQAAMGDTASSLILDEAKIRQRYKRGDVQQLCAVCERWRWCDERCGDFVLGMK